MQIQIPMVAESSAKLQVTKFQLRYAVDADGHVLAAIPPGVFLTLTTKTGTNIDGATDLKKFNELTKKGAIDVMPFLVIDAEKEKVVGHEGRHRAKALMDEGGMLMPIMLKLRGTHKFNKDIRAKDMPNLIKGEFGSGFVKKRNIKILADGQEAVMTGTHSL